MSQATRRSEPSADGVLQRLAGVAGGLDRRAQPVDVVVVAGDRVERDRQRLEQLGDALVLLRRAVLGHVAAQQHRVRARVEAGDRGDRGLQGLRRARVPGADGHVRVADLGEDHPSCAVRQPRTPAKPSRPAPATTSTAVSRRGPKRLRTSATSADSAVKAVSVPHPTPASSSATPAPDSPAPPSDAVEAAAKIAAQVAIVSGFEAVAASEVAKARPGEADLLLGLAAEPHPERGPQRARPDHGEHDGAERAERHAQRVDLEQAGRARQAEAGVEQVDDRGAGADRDAGPERAAQHRAHAQQRHRPGLGPDEQAEAEAHQGCAHAFVLSARANCRSSAASRSSHCPPTSAIHAIASDIGAGVGR